MENLKKIDENIDEISIKIQWKIVQNRGWRRVGPSWGLLGCLIGVLERLGSILGASWERLGASWGRPGGIPEREGDPTWTSGWAQNRSKACSIFRSFLFISILDRSWGPKSLKMSTSCTREAHFHKIGFSDSDIFLEATIMKKGSHNGPKMA